MWEPYPEMDHSTQTKLALISEQARKDPKLQFTSIAHLLNKRFLKECYFGLGRDRASGIDGVSWKEYGEQLDENLGCLVARMKSKRYKPQPAKRVYIPKNEHEKRPLGLPSLEDKIVQKGIAHILEAIYEVDFLDCSYGFRSGRGCHHALKVVDNTIMTKPVNHIIEADIKGFFDNVSHTWMMEFLQVRIKDPSFLLLIRRFLKAGYVDADQLVLTTQAHRKVVISVQCSPIYSCTMCSTCGVTNASNHEPKVSAPWCVTQMISSAWFNIRKMLKVLSRPCERGLRSFLWNYTQRKPA